MKRASGPRKTARIPDSLHRQLNMYALAASAAGVSVLAMGQPVEAKIVYTPAHHVIGADRNYQLIFRDTPEFTLSHGSGDNGRTYSFVELLPRRRENGAVGNASYASALHRGSPIGGSRRFLSKTARLVWGYWSNGPWYGHWVNVKNRYLGLKFQINGRVHYGWARMSVSVTDGKGILALLTGYAYETVPGKAIIAGATKGPDDAEPATSLDTPTPEPATLGVLALGAPGLSIWRREESVAATFGSN
jgi:hypothetical protein